jgi:hypothetical protein
VALRALLQNVARLLVLAVAGVLGALVVVWARANTEWAPVNVPAVMAPGQARPLEYEARIYAIVGVSYLAGVVTCVWLALAVWVRAVRRERRLARALERLEAQIDAGRPPAASSRPIDPLAPLAGHVPSLPAPRTAATLADGVDRGLLSDAPRLPAGYDDLDDDDDDIDDDLDVTKEEPGRG